MQASNRTLDEWFNRVRTGQLRLPRFQRHESWSHQEVAGLVETVLRGLPAGAALVLDVGDTEPFISRKMVGAPEPSERVFEHLLDGQQRLTALWRSLHDDYPDRTYFLRSAADEDDGAAALSWEVVGQARWSRKGVRYPVWADDPVQVHKRGFIPLSLLQPGDIGTQIQDWADAASGDDVAASRTIERIVHPLRGAVTSYNVPYLALPVGTPKDVALDVFIKMNTSSVRLSAFDIVVAQFEEATDRSLHDLVEELNREVPRAHRYRDVGNWVLDTAALRDGRTPTQASYQKLDLGIVANDWGDIVAGIGWAVDVLAEECVFDGDRLPSVAVLPILAALHRSLPTDPDALGNARALVRSYLWRAFLTRRYEQSAGSRSLRDFQGLDDLLRKVEGAEPPIFREADYPLPSGDELIAAGWPNKKEILARGILALSLRAGGRDLADDARATAENVRKREYHHLFPDSILTGPGQLDSEQSFRALNCALITWRTNRKISAHQPLRYLRDRIEGSNLGEETVRSRLASHLIPYEPLAAAGDWATDVAKSDADVAASIVADYEQFLRARALLLIAPMRDLADGKDPTQGSVASAGANQ